MTLQNAIQIRSLLTCACMALILYCLTANAHSAETLYMDSTVISEMPVIDGILDEAMWKTSPNLPLLFNRLQGFPARSETKIWVRHDEQAIYAAIEARGEDRLIASDKPTTDVLSLLVSPHIKLRLDTLSSGERKIYQFAANPFGSKNESLAGSWSWNSHWLAASRIVADGFDVEISIPFTALALEKRPKTLRFSVERIASHPHPEVQGWPVLQGNVETMQLRFEPQAESTTSPTAPAPIDWSARIDALITAEPGAYLLDDEDATLASMYSNQLGRLAIIKNHPEVFADVPGYSDTAERAVEHVEKLLERIVSKTPGIPSIDRVAEIPLPKTEGHATLLLCGADEFKSPVPVIIVLGPAKSSPDVMAASLASWRRQIPEPCLIAIPSDVSRFGDQNFHGAAELRDLLAQLDRLFTVDHRRIYITGTNEGGSAALRTAMHLPDLFAAVVSADGPMDLRLIENLLHVKTMIYGASADKTLPANHWSHAWSESLKKLKMPISQSIYNPAKTTNPLVPFMDIDFAEKLLETKRPETLRRVAFIAPSPAFSHSAWVSIERFASWPPNPRVDIQVTEENKIEGKASGVGELAVDLTGAEFSPDKNVTLAINGVVFYEGPYRSTLEADMQESAQTDTLSKSATLGGTLDEAFNGRAIYIYGSKDSDQWAAATKEAAQKAANRIDAEMPLPVLSDKEWLASNRFESNLFLFGGPARNEAILSLGESLPVTFTQDGLKIGETLIHDDNSIVQFVYPNPWNPEKYVVVHWTRTPEAMRKADWNPSPWRFHLLPDGLIDKIESHADGVSRRKTVAEIWFDENWLPVPIRARN